MKVAVFGLGYVGCVTAACLAERGHEVVGVDVVVEKVESIAAGQSPLAEPGLAELIAKNHAEGRLTATTDATGAVLGSDVSLVCVGTPSAANGSLGTEALERAVHEIGTALRDSFGRHVVVIRSTMVPGTCERMVIPLLEQASGRSAGSDFGVAVNPEFLREGSSIADFNAPAKTVIGELDHASGDVVASLYEGLPGTVVRTGIAVAEMAKYVDNAFHALKATFANEIGSLCRALGLDSHEVMKSFLVDTRLNISTAYLKPGFAFGGSCLPKDLRALLHTAKLADVDMPVLEAVLESNEKTIGRVVNDIVSLGRKRVGVIGLSFKQGTDDLRESPLVELSERLLGKGFDLRIYDPGVSLARLHGANRAYISDRIPHLSALLSDSLDDVLAHAEVVVVGAKHEDAIEAMTERAGVAIIDLVRLPNAEELREGAAYIGVAW